MVPSTVNDLAIICDELPSGWASFTWIWGGFLTWGVSQNGPLKFMKNPIWWFYEPRYLNNDGLNPLKIHDWIDLSGDLHILVANLWTMSWGTFQRLPSAFWSLAPACRLSYPCRGRTETSRSSGFEGTGCSVPGLTMVFPQLMASFQRENDDWPWLTMKFENIERVYHFGKYIGIVEGLGSFRGPNGPFGTNPRDSWIGPELTFHDEMIIQCRQLSPCPFLPLTSTILTNLKQPRMWWWWKARWCKKSMNGESWRETIWEAVGTNCSRIPWEIFGGCLSLRVLSDFLALNAWILHQ